MTSPVGAVPALVFGAKVKAAPAPVVTGLNQQIFPAGQADNRELPAGGVSVPLLGLSFQAPEVLNDFICKCL